MSETVNYGSDSSQFMQLHWPPNTNPTERLPLAFLIHGGFWKEQYGINPPTAAIDSLPPALTARGYLVALPEYRRVSDSINAVWGPGYTDSDVAVAFARILENPRVDSNRVIVLGHSAGATLALSLPSPYPTLVIAVAPVGDLCRAADLRLSDNGDAVQRYMQSDPPYRRACPACRSNQLAVANLIVYTGTADTDVPVGYVTNFYNSISPAFLHSPFKCKLQIIANADHYDVIDAGSSAAAPLLAIFERFASSTIPS